MTEANTALRRDAVAEFPATRSEFRQGGDSEPITLPGNFRKLIAKRIRDGADDARTRKGNGEQPDFYDRILGQGRGLALAEKFDNPEVTSLTRGDLALAWAVVERKLAGAALDGVDFAASDTRKALDEWRENVGGTDASGRPIDRRPLLRSLRIDDVVERIITRRLRTGENTQAYVSERPAMTSGATTGREGWSDAERRADVIELHMMQVAFERQLGFSYVVVGGHVPDYDNPGQSRLVQEVRRWQDAAARERGFLAFDDPRLTGDTVNQDRVRREGLKKGLQQFADDDARRLLMEEEPKIDVGKITAAKDKINGALKPEELESVEYRIREAQEILDDGRARSKGLRVGPDSIQALQAKILEIDAEIAALPALTPGSNRAELEENARISNKNLTLTGERTRLNSRVGAKTTERGVLVATVAVPPPLSPSNLPPVGSLQEMEYHIALVKAEKKGTMTAVDSDRYDGLEGWEKVFEPDNYARLISTPFEQSFDSPYHRDRLADATLDPTINSASGGELRGAEAIRHLIFGAAYEGDGPEADLQRERIRRMFSDEVIGRLLMERGGIDRRAQFDTGAPPYATYGLLLDAIRNRRNQYDVAVQNALTAGGDFMTDAVCLGRRTALRDLEHKLLEQLLPRFANMTNFEIGDWLRRGLVESGQSAETGKPFLQVPNHYERQTPEAERTTASIVSEGYGGVIVTEPRGREGARVMWQGRLRGVSLDPAGTYTSAEDLELRITERFGSRLLDASVGWMLQIPWLRNRIGSRAPLARGQMYQEVQVNTRDNNFLAYVSTLPQTRPPGLPLTSEIARYCYSPIPPYRRRTGDARTWWQSAPEWVTIDRRFLNRGIDPAGGADILNPASGTGGGLLPAAQERFNITTAVDIIDRKKPQERLTILRGFRRVTLPFIELPHLALATPGAVAPEAIEVSMLPNGEFVIRTPGSNNIAPNTPLTTYLAAQIDGYENADDALRTRVRDAERRIYEMVGQEIMRTQLRR